MSLVLHKNLVAPGPTLTDLYKFAFSLFLFLDYRDFAEGGELVAVVFVKAGKAPELDAERFRELKALFTRTALHRAGDDRVPGLAVFGDFELEVLDVAVDAVGTLPDRDAFSVDRATEIDGERMRILSQRDSVLAVPDRVHITVDDILGVALARLGRSAGDDDGHDIVTRADIGREFGCGHLGKALELLGRANEEVESERPVAADDVATHGPGAARRAA